ncbi:major facilitator superfamily domain-containing protein [Calycina marina]|uniref:Major facilitator superfamily domain-containing protein n=1 Tax=Calycina marina TaxID=1763456 RepID=A0A9P7YXL4_9HELO|nr:major facilitator superfamily domain-containing protein [Calycina marina]
METAGTPTAPAIAPTTSHSDVSLRKVTSAGGVPHTETVEHANTNLSYDEKKPVGESGSSDALDHEQEPPLSFRRLMSMIAMAFLWTGSQIPVYLFGGIPPIIYADIGGTDRWVWFVLANLLALAAVCPFVGAISDLMGRRYVALTGATLIVVGMIICSTAHSMNIFIAGMAIAGAGAGINELTALAVTSELAPTRKRGKYVAILIFTIVPFCPSVLWAQLIAQHSSWRYVGLFCALWAFTGLVMTAVFYFPPPRDNSKGLTSKETIARIDFVGGLLSISGMILFIAGLVWGGYQYTWHSAHVLVTLLLGSALLIAFYIWETKFAKFPMFPHRLKQDPRILAMTLVITFISGANFFSVLLFWPTQAFNVYGHDPVGVGIRGIPIGFSIMIGACVVLWLLSVLRGHNRLLMVVSCCFMTAGCGALAAARTDNIGVVYLILAIAGLGIGGIVVPASIITTIICPPDLIATIAAITLAIRVVGGAVGYTIYYNIFYAKFVPKLTQKIIVACIENQIYNATVITEVAELTGASLLNEILYLPGVDGNVTIWNSLVKAGQEAYAESYPYVYYVSIAFGSIAIIASACLGDITKYMDNHVAVVIE